MPAMPPDDAIDSLLALGKSDADEEKVRGLLERDPEAMP